MCFQRFTKTAALLLSLLAIAACKGVGDDRSSNSSAQSQTSSVSCQNESCTPKSVDFKDPQQAYDYYRSQWEKQKPQVFSYSVARTTRFCQDCSFDARLIFEDGDYQAYDIHTLKQDAAFTGNSYTIEYLFDRISVFLDKGLTFNATYNTTYGYPEFFDEGGDESILITEMAKQNEPWHRYYGSRILWVNSAIHNYHITMLRSCACPLTGEFALNIENASSRSIFSSALSRDLNADERNQIPNTVDALFDVIDNALSARNTVQVEYDLDYGVPLFITTNSVNLKLSNFSPTAETDALQKLMTQQSIWLNKAPKNYFYTYSNNDTQRWFTTNGVQKKPSYAYRNQVTGSAESALLVFESYQKVYQNVANQSIQGMFEIAKTAMNGDTLDWSVDYDAEYGYPISVRVGSVTHTIAEFSLQKSAFDTFYKNLELWQALDMNRYDFHLIRTLGNGPSTEYSFNFSYGDITGVNVNQASGLSASDIQSLESQVYALYATLKKGLSDPNKSVKATYDERYFFPREIEITSSKLEENISIRVTNFQQFNHQEIEKFDLLQQQWKALNVQNYTYRYTYDCFIFCTRVDARVTVKNGVITAAQSIASGAAVKLDLIKSIESVFADIRQQITGGQKVGSYQYHEKYHFPLGRRYTGREETGDDDYWYSVGEFELTQP